jgi:hypothetical protein
MCSASNLWLLLSFAAATVLAGCTGSIENGATPDGLKPTVDKVADRPGSQPGAGSSADRPGDPGDPSAPGSDPSSPGSDPTCVERSPGESPIRRLSNAEYRNTIADLLEDEPLAERVSARFVSETESLGFRNSAKFLQINTVTAQHYMDAAEEIAKQVRAQPAAILPCTPAAAAEEAACAEQFIGDFGRKLYRRPLIDAELASYRAIYDSARAERDFATGVEWVAFAMLQSPHFLNRVELSDEPGSGELYARPSSYAMASRLSYLLWQSMPDQALFDAAEQDALSTDAEVAAQARRMLADPKAKRVYQFFAQWLDVDELPAMERDGEVYPDYDAALPGLLAEETRAFVDHVLWDGAGDLGTLLTAPYTFANAQLAEHYGLDGVSGDGFVQIDTPGRAGLLTLGGVVSVHDKPTRSSIVLRGLRVRTELLCQVVGAPPADIVVDLPEIAPGMPQSSRLEMHRAEPLCAGCHNLMDPLGVPFESFDALGRLRSEDEQGNAVETAGAISHTRTSNAPVADAIELSARLAESDEVRACFATQAFRFFYGREEGDDDRCSIEQLVSAFERSNYSIQELLVALTQTDAFLYRPTTVQP